MNNQPKRYFEIVQERLKRNGTLTGAEDLTLILSDELDVALSLVKEHQAKQKIYHCADTLAQRIRSVMDEYETTAAKALGVAKEFRDRIIIDLRALSMVLAMTDNASTHREKSARLRGATELIESAIRRLERLRFDISVCNHPQFDDVFASDFPTRHYVERIHELEAQVAQLTEALPKTGNGNDLDKPVESSTQLF